MKLIPFLSAVLVFVNVSAHADEKIEKASYWISRGYTEVATPKAFQGNEIPTWNSHSLKWPVAFQDVQHSIGNSMAEYQNYGSEGPYFHGGCDLRVQRAAAVTTPVAGRIEAGHYGYTNNPDGSMTKFWTPWPGGGDSTYFEIAVITDDGYRFEFHHMDENRISPDILNGLKAGGGRAAAGTVLGRTIPWPGFNGYHHTHYNIISPSGIRLNPEFYSPLLTDTLKPEVKTLFASMKNKSTVDFGSGSFSERPEFFAAVVVDHQDANTYDHPPVYAGIQFNSGEKYIWDFRERLLSPEGQFPNIWSFFIDTISGPDGRSYSTSGGYGTGESVIQIPVPAAAKGAFTIQIGDAAGNMTSYSGTLSIK